MSLKNLLCNVPEEIQQFILSELNNYELMCNSLTGKLSQANAEFADLLVKYNKVEHNNTILKDLLIHIQDITNQLLPLKPHWYKREDYGPNIPGDDELFLQSAASDNADLSLQSASHDNNAAFLQSASHDNNNTVFLHSVSVLDTENLSHFEPIRDARLHNW